MDSIWAADLVDMQSFAKNNKGFKYILMIIDLFSKYGWAFPMKTKTGLEVTKNFEHLFKTQNSPKKLWTDKGKEFYNRYMSDLLKTKNIQLYSTENEEKSSVVERWNRTIKRIMWKYFTANNTLKYIDVLPDIIQKYNNTYHRSIKCTSSVARKPSYFQHVSEALYGNEVQSLKPAKYKLDDWVRIVRKKYIFEKAFTPGWTEELFIIIKVNPTNPVTYNIEDTNGEKIQGSFYEEELQKSNQEIYRIEKVLKKRTKKDGTQEIFVKWYGYNDNFNTWIPLTDIEERIS